MVSPQLIDYIKQQLALGKSHADITPLLLNAGWKQEDINEAFSQLNNSTPAPVASLGNELPAYSVLFKDAFRLLSQRFNVIILSGLTLIGGLLLAAIVGLGIWFAVYKSVGGTPSLITGVALGAVGFVLYIYALLWGTSAAITAMRDAAENTGTMENLRRAKPFAGRIFWVRVLSGLAAAGGFVLLVIPGIILTIRYAFSSFVAVNEDQKGRSALAHSYAYVYGRTGKVFLRFLSLYIIYLIPDVILQLIAKYANSAILVAVAGVLLTALQIFFAFYSLTFLYTLYLQLKQTAGQVDAQKYIRRTTGWAIWGIFASLVLIAGIGFLSIKAYQLGIKDRDNQRVEDVNTISLGLNLYYKDHGAYPKSLDDLAQGYLPDGVPTGPKTSDCNKNQHPYSSNFLKKDKKPEYVYTPSQDLKNYELNFCLGAPTNDYEAGPNTVTANH